SVAKAATGSTIRNTGEMRPMGTGKRRINSAVRVLLIVLAAELERDPVAAELEHAQVAVELEHAQVAAELVLAPGAAELELVQVAAELEPVQGEAELELVRAAVPLRTKSVIAQHHRGLVPVLGAEDLAVEVETTRVPAATEAVVAWEGAECGVGAGGDAGAE